MGRRQFRRVRFQAPSSVSIFGFHRVPGNGLSEFLSAHYLCAKANSPSFISQNSPSLLQNSVSSLFSCMGGVEKVGERKTSRKTPIPKRGFGHPFLRYVFHPLRGHCSVFPVQKSTSEQARSSFGGPPNFSGGCVLWCGFPTPIRFAPPPPHIHWEIKGRFRKRVVLAYPRSCFRTGGTCERTSFRFSFRGNIRMYPRSGFRSGGTSAKTTCQIRWNRNTLFATFGAFPAFTKHECSCSTCGAFSSIVRRKEAFMEHIWSLK